MKVLHISCFDNGGAGIAAVRLHKALNELGAESKMLVMDKRTATPGVFQVRPTNKYGVLFQRILKNLGMPLTLEHANDNKARRFKGNFDYFSFARTSFTELANHPLVQECDVVNLHWVANFLDYPSFFSEIEKPVVWTMHDMNAFQGGFHYKEDDVRNRDILFKENHEQYQCKLDSLNLLPAHQLTVVSPSKWMREEAGKSEILGKFEHCHIANGVDTRTFRPKRSDILEAYGVSAYKIVILFVSESVRNPRKGFDFVAELAADPSLREICEFVAVGSARKSQRLPGVKYIGRVDSEELLSEIYGAADIYLLPSREDNLPNVMMESLACGTPVIGFNLGGMKDVIINGQNGYLSSEISAAGLRDAFVRCISTIAPSERDRIAQDFREKYTIEKQAKSYLNLYHELSVAVPS